MSPLSSRSLVTAGAAALALALAPTAALADQGGGGDPAGNNGTIKINPYGETDGNANHPHPGCDFRLTLFGFDDDQTGTITFTGQAPTSDAVTAQPLAGTQLLSDDAAGGGKDVDASYDVRGADLGLTGTPHPKQGFHIKVRVDADGAPGGAKTKVFWLDCPTPAAAKPTTTTTTTTTAATPTTDEPTTGATTSAPSTTAVQGTPSAPPAGTTAPTTAQTTTEGASAAAPGELMAFTGGRAGAVRAPARTGTAQGDAGALPFTGLPAVGLLALALGALAAGGLAVAAGRRRTDSV